MRRHRLEPVEASANILLRSLARLANDVGPAVKPVGHDDLLGAIATTARHLFSAAGCSVALLDGDTQELEFYVASGVGTDDITGLRVPANVGIAGYVAATGEPLDIQDVGKDPRFARDVALRTGYVPRSILAVPLRTQSETIGVIEVLDRGPGREDRRDMELFLRFADLAAMAIAHTRVFTAMGRELLAALAEATDDAQLGAALRLAAGVPTPSSPEMAELAALFNELGRCDPEEQRLAIRVVNEFLAHARAARRPSQPSAELSRP
ncbi:MAG: GAF domain-containing protein [Actinomycetota bacterium]